MARVAEGLEQVQKTQTTAAEAVAAARAEREVALAKVEEAVLRAGEAEARAAEASRRADTAEARLDELQRLPVEAAVGTVKLLALGRPSWRAEGDAGTEFKLRQQPR
jgi:hypothetical protein